MTGCDLQPNTDSKQPFHEFCCLFVIGKRRTPGVNLLFGGHATKRHCQQTFDTPPECTNPILIKKSAHSQPLSTACKGNSNPPGYPSSNLESYPTSKSSLAARSSLAYALNSYQSSFSRNSPTRHRISSSPPPPGERTSTPSHYRPWWRMNLN